MIHVFSSFEVRAICLFIHHGGHSTLRSLSGYTCQHTASNEKVSWVTSNWHLTVDNLGFLEVNLFPSPLEYILNWKKLHAPGDNLFWTYKHDNLFRKTKFERWLRQNPSKNDHPVYKYIYILPNIKFSYFHEIF